ncbi:hypothetical protein FA13DRAFT_1733162 [Coprinellus micaceus]|uniref:Secreted protein n=1 Tax=Coprinellus micaceus TaxID=71717 RepID=A0A4Y7T9P8_COPMI|nr:hypothetical protein FA13DRAFT_1733162 [Coprinellus micaceus]
MLSPVNVPFFWFLGEISVWLADGVGHQAIRTWVLIYAAQPTLSKSVLRYSHRFFVASYARLWDRPPPSEAWCICRSECTKHQKGKGREIFQRSCWWTRICRIELTWSRSSLCSHVILQGRSQLEVLICPNSYSIRHHLLVLPFFLRPQRP